MWQLRSSILDYVSRPERPTNPVKNNMEAKLCFLG